MISCPPLLEVENLRVRFATDGGTAAAVNGVSLVLGQGETLAVLGESGSGKSVPAQAIMGIVPSPPGRVRADAIRLNGRELTTLCPADYRAVRGREMALIFQDSLTSLNPRFTIGTQICELLRVHLGLSRKAARDRAAALLADVGIASPAARLDDYPHQFSGGMRQRALIAMAIALEPRLLIADEPTTALDVTVQAQVLDLLQKIQARAGMGLILITHDFAVARSVARRVAVMYAGSLVEQAPTTSLFADPRHPYTLGLMNSTPRRTGPGGQLTPIAGSPPDLRALPPGCAFRPRCGNALDLCGTRRPGDAAIGEDRLCSCHNPVRGHG